MAPQTYSVKVYAAILLGGGPDPDDRVGSLEPYKVEWLERRLRGAAEPTLPGYKVGRRWRALADVRTSWQRPRQRRGPELGNRYRAMT